jgi:hypothetical protein
MAALTTVPITVEPDAAARVAELGMQAELQQMIEHTRQVVPHLQNVRVVLEPPYDTGDEPYLTIYSTRGGSYNGDDPTQREWGRWKVTTFSPDVCRHFAMLVIYGNAHAG